MGSDRPPGQEPGRAPGGVIARLFREGYLFDFFQAVRLLQLQSQQTSATGVPPGATPDASRGPVGRDGEPGREIVRFRTHQSLTFPTSEIERLGPHGPARRTTPEAEHRPAEDAPPEMFVNFMGLTGPNGVLPRHYTQLVLQQMRDGADTVADFFDLFNHRLISLFYRAWEKYRAAILVEQSRSAPSRGVDLFTLALFSRGALVRFVPLAE